MLFILLGLAVAFLQSTPARPRPATALVVLANPTQAAVPWDAAFKFTAVEDGVLFDIDGDGVVERVAWTAPGAGVAFLALDMDADGRITSGKELIGNQTVVESPNGFAALQHLRSRDGQEPSGAVAPGDPLYRKLLVWQDLNHDGISDANELRPAADLFTRIPLGYWRVQRHDEHGNVFWFGSNTEARTAQGQGAARDAKDHEARLRPMFEVALVTSG
ncbi:MAG TPA: hypothetical protein VNT60_08715 [Deinococcales bacterium]|nr:hypothetical protein [Deinococcales bacterium]